MFSGSPYSLVSEMLEAPGLLRHFDEMQGADWRRAIADKKKLLITGEGSSRIFPAKNMIDLSLKQGGAWQICTEGARQAAEYELGQFIVIGASNSGRTRELISLFEKLTHKNITRYGITATAGSRLTEIVTDLRLLNCGQEKATAATKSVVEQALVYQSLLAGAEWRHKHRAADYCEKVLGQTVSPDITDSVRNAPVVYFSGRNNGVAEELTLKTNEIVRKRSDYLEGTYAVHGIEEVMGKDDAVILIEPFQEEIEKYQSILATGIGVKIIAVASFDTPFPMIKVPALPGFDGYFQLLAGWNVLVAAGLANGVNLDRPKRARKVGNEI
ncbi:MAG: sugar isomerase [Proteobacteria bacterium]|nr:sugar isomerase [Pseudomonadota bacterium]